LSRTKNPVLNEKHRKALALIEAGGHTLDEVSKLVGWKQDYLYELYEGDTSKAGSVASVFSAECRKIDKKQTQRIKELAKHNKALAHKLIQRILKDIETNEKLSNEDRKLVGTMMNCLAKATPNVEIGSVSYSYTKGYTAEQLIHEYNRLKTLAGGSSNRRAVQEAFSGRPGTLPGTAESGDSVAEEE
jgi:hypothetical protein